MVRCGEPEQMASIHHLTQLDNGIYKTPREIPEVSRLIGRAANHPTRGRHLS